MDLINFFTYPQHIQRLGRKRQVDKGGLEKQHSIFNEPIHQQQLCQRQSVFI